MVGAGLISGGSEDAPSSESSQTIQARKKASRLATYVGVFVSGLVAAAVPLLGLIEKLAEHKAALAVVLSVVERFGAPAVIAGGCVFLMHQQAKRHERDRQRQSMENLAALRLVSEQIVSSLNEVKSEVRGLHARFDEEREERSGQVQRIEDTTTGRHRAARPR